MFVKEILLPSWQKNDFYLFTLLYYSFVYLIMATSIILHCNACKNDLLNDYVYAENIEELKERTIFNYYIQIQYEKDCNFCKDTINAFFKLKDDDFDHEELRFNFMDFADVLPNKHSKRVINMEFLKNYGIFSTKGRTIYQWSTDREGNSETISGEQFLNRVQNGSILLIKKNKFAKLYQEISGFDSLPIRDIFNTKVIIYTTEYKFYLYDKILTKPAKK
jgi:hypothetical protein